MRHDITNSEMIFINFLFKYSKYKMVENLKEYTRLKNFRNILLKTILASFDDNLSEQEIIKLLKNAEEELIKVNIIKI